MTSIEVIGVNSIWHFIECANRYHRRPLTPRERPEWGDERAGPCEDHKWHRYVHYWVTEDRRRLIIVPVGFAPFWAPLTPDATDPFALWDELHRHLGTEALIEAIKTSRHPT